MKLCYNYLLLIFFVFAVNATQAQVTFGLKGGVNLSHIENNFADLVGSITGEAGTNSKTGYNAGIFVGLPVNELLRIRAELVYSFEGAEFENFTVNVDGNLNYVNVPVFLKINLTSSITLNAGVEGGLIIGDRDEVFFEKTNDLALLGGIGVRLGEKLGIDVRYLHGVVDIAAERTYTDDNGNAIGSLNAKSRMWQIGLEWYLFQ